MSERKNSMIVVAGTKIFKKTLGYSKALISCEQCQYSTHWEYLRCREWITACFIPIIPLPSKEVFCCPECGFGIKLNKYNEHRILPLINPLK